MSVPRRKNVVVIGIASAMCVTEMAVVNGVIKRKVTVIVIQIETGVSGRRIVVVIEIVHMTKIGTVAAVAEAISNRLSTVMLALKDLKSQKSILSVVPIRIRIGSKVVVAAGDVVATANGRSVAAAAATGKEADEERMERFRRDLCIN